MNSTWSTVLAATFLVSQSTAVQDRPPIIDMHLHALPADFLGTPGGTYCPGNTEKVFPAIDPRKPLGTQRTESCAQPFVAPLTSEDVMRQSLAALDRYNIRAVTSGPLELVKTWKAASPNRIIPALSFTTTDGVSPDRLREVFQKGEFTVLGEVGTQYQGISPSDPALEPYLAVAEELDIPVGIHMGEGFPGSPYFPGTQGYRARLSNPLLLEDALIRHPKLRLYVMHAGWPMLDEMINLLYSYPQVYADLSDIASYIPRKEFHHYLRRLVEAGFGQRLMFGSDQMIWPQVIGVAIESIESAGFLTTEPQATSSITMRPVFCASSRRSKRCRTARCS